MRYVIFGAGAIGGLLGARLALARADVCFVARGEALARIRSEGIVLRNADGREERTGPLQAVEHAAEAGECDVVVIALKAHQLAQVAPTLKPLLKGETLVLPMQNGLPFWYFHGHGGDLEGRVVRSVDPEGAVRDSIDPARVIGCVVYMAAEREGPGIVRHVGGNRIMLGELDGSRGPRIERLSQALLAAGLDAPVVDDIRSEVWLKLWGNLAFNAISALSHATLAGVCGDGAGRSLVEQMMREAQAVMAHYGIAMRVPLDKRIEGAARVGHHKTSMLQDVEAGRALEIDALTGAVVELAELAGVATPTIKAIYQAVKLLDRTMAAERAAVRLARI